MPTEPVVIIGGGLSGLCCARSLAEANVDFLLLESEDGLGGRVRTDCVDGFLLDHGFQVLQTAYPETQRQLDYDALELQSFQPGALIRTRDRTVKMSDPWRRPQDTFATLLNGIGTLADRLRLAKLRARVTRGSLEELWAQPDKSTREFLEVDCQFSTDMIERFFRPWFSGVFLEDELATSSLFFQFIFRMFALGGAALPSQGMGAISAQLSAKLPESQIRLRSRVVSISPATGDGCWVELESGEKLAARAIVLATAGPQAFELAAGDLLDVPSKSTYCFYFAAAEPPISAPLLLLNGDMTGPVNNLCVPTNVAPSYATNLPEGRRSKPALVSVSTVGLPRCSPSDSQSEAAVEEKIREHLTNWFGHEVAAWDTLRSYRIKHALPAATWVFQSEKRDRQAFR